MWWWHHHHIFSVIYYFWGREVSQKYAVWVLVGCGLLLEIWVKAHGNMLKIRIKQVVYIMTNMSSQPLWLTRFIEILLVLEFQLTKSIIGALSYKAHFRPRISSNDVLLRNKRKINLTGGSSSSWLLWALLSSWINVTLDFLLTEKICSTCHTSFLLD